MPIPPLKRRKYGYLDDEPKKRTIVDTETANKPKQNHIVSVLLFPFKLLFWLPKKIWQKLPHRPKKNKGAIWRKIFGFLITCFILGILGLTVLTAWVSRDLPDPDRLSDRHVAQSTKIYDRTGEHLLYEVFAQEKRTMVNLEDIPDLLVNAVIATEDTAFYQHKGIRPLSILRSFAYGIIGKSRLGAGASTLTQQLVKNAILTNERTYTRKLKEIILSLRLEQKYSKDQILKIYFNEIPYGSTNYGVESAAQSYFKKSVSQLNLSEIATIAGFPKAPSTYLTDKTALKNRRDFVLERMVEEKYITREEADAAQATSIEISQDYGKIEAPHFVLYVKGKLVEEYGEQMVDTGGLRVITTLDWDKQKAAEAAIKEESDKSFKESKTNNASIVAMDPKNGQVLAMVGSRDFFDESIDGQFNVATLGKRQPGSSFKPIIYAAAFEKGYTPDTLLFDVETNFSVTENKEYKPKNYDLKEHGLVTMRKALQISLNIPAVQTLYLVGQKNGVDFAGRMGYTTLGEGDFGLSLVLGGGEVKLIDHTNAYGIFANGGTYYKPVSILRVEDSNGDILEEWKKSRGEKVLDDKVAATISNVLSDDESRASVFGAGGVLTLSDRPVAAKTGTTNSYVDAWTIGYTPSLVAGVWAGNTNNTPMNKGDGGSRVAAPIWNHFMREALKNSPVEQFPPLPPNDAEKPVLRGSGSTTGITLLIDRVTNKRATSSTPEMYITERTYIPPHSILHYVNKDDPRGPTPEDPTLDPQYSVWEAAIQDWVRRNKEENPNWEISFEEPPTEYDDAHSLELIPSLTVNSPMTSSTLQTRNITTDINVTAPRGVTKVTYKIDRRQIATVHNTPFNLNYYATGLENGVHTLTIVVEDDIGNSLQQDIPFTLEAGVEQPAVFWAEKSQIISQDQFPRVFFLNYVKLDQLKEVTIYKQKDNNKTLIKTLTDFTNLFNNQINFSWNEVPEKGNWTLIAEITLKNNTHKVSDQAVITVQ